jgi:hypothetical protein
MHLLFCINHLPDELNLPHDFSKKPGKGRQQGGEKDLEEFAYTAPARLLFTPYIW